MTKNLDKDGFCSIVDNYQLFYIDLWGVIHNGINLHKEAINVLKEITKKGKEYILLTNAPRPNDVVKSFLEKMGMEKEIRDHVFTSGQAALKYLKTNFKQKKFFHLGPLRDFILFEQRGTQYAQPSLDCPEWAKAVYQSNLPSFDSMKTDSLFQKAAK